MKSKVKLKGNITQEKKSENRMHTDSIILEGEKGWKLCLLPLLYMLYLSRIQDMHNNILDKFLGYSCSTWSKKCIILVSRIIVITDLKL